MRCDIVLKILVGIALFFTDHLGTNFLFKSLLSWSLIFSDVIGSDLRFQNLLVILQRERDELVCIVWIQQQERFGLKDNLTQFGCVPGLKRLPLIHWWLWGWEGRSGGAGAFLTSSCLLYRSPPSNLSYIGLASLISPLLTNYCWCKLSCATLSDSMNNWFTNSNSLTQLCCWILFFFYLLLYSLFLFCFWFCFVSCFCFFSLAFAIPLDLFSALALTLSTNNKLQCNMWLSVCPTLAIFRDVL